MIGAIGTATRGQGVRLSPERTTIGTPRSPAAHVAPSGVSDALAAALAAPVRGLKGIDPGGFARRFDLGRVTRREDGRVLREFDLVTVEVSLEVAPGVFVDAWTFNGSVPGPTLRCTEGDVVRVRLTNRSQADHTAHFHGVHSYEMDGVRPLVRPGESYVYEFTAQPAGLHVYHCHVPPVALHIARGMFGVFLVDPPSPLPPADELVLVLHAWDLEFDDRNDLYAINGAANWYRDNPIALGQDRLVRVYLASMLEHEPITGFHLHANVFRELCSDYCGRQGCKNDTVLLGQAQRTTMEFKYSAPGLYMFHPHLNRQAELGATGHFVVSAAEESPRTISNAESDQSATGPSARTTESRMTQGARRASLILSVIAACGLVFVGIRAISPRRGSYAATPRISLRSWPTRVSSVGVHPQGAAVRACSIGYGLAWLVCAAHFADGAAWAWWGMLCLAIGLLGAIPMGTLLGLLQILALSAATLFERFPGGSASLPMPIPKSDSRARQLPAFSLLDQTGGLVTAAALRGRPALLFWFYTDCPLTCPALIGELQHLAANVGDSNVRLVGLSLSPERDTPERLRAYARGAGLDPARWLLLTGDRRAIGELAQSILEAPVFTDSTQQIPTESGSISKIIHPSRVALCDPTGTIVQLANPSQEDDLNALCTSIINMRSR